LGFATLSANLQNSSIRNYPNLPRSSIRARGLRALSWRCPTDVAAAQSWRQSGHAVEADSILGFYALTLAFVLTGDLPAQQAKRCSRSSVWPSA